MMDKNNLINFHLFNFFSERCDTRDSGIEEDLMKRADSPPVSPGSSSICRDRRSPKRQHSVSEKSFKKLKLDDKDDNYRLSPKPYHIHPTM